MIEVAAIAFVMVLLSVLGLVWDFASGLITAGIDGIFLLLICLMVGGLFSLQLLYLVYERRHKASSSGGK
ncbi:MAG: hypothetical protein WA020_13750 [Candidatus Acidiferrales bacterium]